MHRGKKILSICMTLLSLGAIASFILLPLYQGTQNYYQTFATALNYIQISANTGVWDQLGYIVQVTVLALIPLILVFVFLRAFISIFIRNAKCRIFGKCTFALIILAVFVFLSLGYSNISFPQAIYDFINNYQGLKDFITLSSVGLDYGFYIVTGIIVLIIILEIFRRYNIKNAPDQRPQEEIELSRFIETPIRKPEPVALKPVEEKVEETVVTPKEEPAPIQPVHNINEDDDIETLWISDSEFDGTTLGFIGMVLLVIFVSIITLFIGLPFMIVKFVKWFASHSVINGRRLAFNGSGSELFGKMLLWFFLTIVTVTIFGLWVPVKFWKYIMSHIHFEDSEDE